MNGYDVDKFGVPKAPRSMMGRKLDPEKSGLGQRFLVYLTDAVMTAVFLTILMGVMLIVQNGMGPLPWDTLLACLSGLFVLLLAAEFIIGEAKVGNYRRDCKEYEELKEKYNIK